VRQQGIGGSGEYCGDNDANLVRINVFYHEAKRVVVVQLKVKKSSRTPARVSQAPSFAPEWPWKTTLLSGVRLELVLIVWAQQHPRRK
jgi:hypothetical protein